MIGSQIEQYTVEAKIGEGGMGSVYRALDVNLDRVVALKFLHQGLGDNAELATRFRTEARAQAALNHYNIATLYALLVWEGKTVMVMEYIDGESMQQMVARRGPIPAHISVPLFKQALQGVAVAHRHGIIHRDLKPANLMVSKDGAVKVMDFGIAKIQGSSGMTRTNMTMGTSWYMAPEQIMGRPVDARTDIYSMGVTLYELLAGQVPFHADSDYEVQTAHVQRPPDRPTLYYPHIPEPVVNAVMRALSKEPSERFSSADEFLRALPDIPEPTISPAAVISVPTAMPMREKRELHASDAVATHMESPSIARQGPQPEVLQQKAKAPDDVDPKKKTARGNRIALLCVCGVALLAVVSAIVWLTRPKAVPIAVTTVTAPSQVSTTPDADDPPMVIEATPPSPAHKPSAQPPAATGRATPAASEPATAAPVALVAGQELTGEWRGTYADTESHAVTSVTLTIREASPDNISGTVSYVTPDHAAGSCQLGKTRFDTEKKQLTLSMVQCAGTNAPAYFNVPTQFADANPSTGVLAHGRTLYLQNNIAVTLRKQ